MQDNLSVIPLRKIKDLSGQVFGKFTVVQLSHRKGINLFWTCRCCICGFEVPARSDSIKNESLRCPNCPRERMLLRAKEHVRKLMAGRAGHPENLAGKTVGSWTAVAFHHKGSQHRYWTCRCVCGTERILRGDNFKEGASCGVCLGIRSAEDLKQQNKKQCSVCKSVLSMDNFNFDKQRRDGLHGRCKDCVIAISQSQRARLKQRKPEEIVAADEKKCRKCKITKPTSEFWKTDIGADGHLTNCADCVKSNDKAYRDKNRDKFRKGHYRRLYGIDVSVVESMLISQNNACAICRRQFPTSLKRRPYFVDHCHSSNKVRALLCTRCNAGLGFFRESPSILRLAARYLESHARHEISSSPTSSPQIPLAL
jgi:Recombination endonuclease VII